MKESEAQAKLSNAVMQAMIRISALERALLQKKVLAEDELAESLAYVVSDVVKTAKDELGVTIDLEAESKGE